MLPVIIVLSGLACQPNKNEILGTYLYENAQEQETIVLKPDHTYTWNFLVKQTSLVKQETGTWKYDQNGGSYISLDYHDAENPAKDKGDTKPIEKWFGKLYLGLDESGAKLYKKID
jgi:hypothetical protein